MPKVLLIDDEPIYYKMIQHALKPHGYELEYARSGMEGLKVVPLFTPDVIITDLRLPDLSGYEVAQRVRGDSRFSSVPIIFLTSQMDLSNKLKAFEVGADDYLVKPFQPEELVARVGMLVRRGEALKAVRQGEQVREEATVVAVHSLRGGVGSSSAALNLAASFYAIWQKPTLVIDTVLNAGQVALMLNASPVRSWGDVAGMKPYEIENELLKSLVSNHASGLDYLASPPYPVAMDLYPDELWPMALDEYKKAYDFIVLDLAHDFSNLTIQMLDAADRILLMLAPDMASIRSAVCALNIYETLEIPSEKVFLVLNQVFPQPGIKQAQIEKVLKNPIKMVIPYIPNEFIRAINYGVPFVTSNPEAPLTAMLEEIVYQFSKDSLKNFPPVAPSAAWKRVNSRIAGRK